MRPVLHDVEEGDDDQTLIDDRDDIGPLTFPSTKPFVRPFKKSGNDSAKVWSDRRYRNELASLKETEQDNQHDYDHTTPIHHSAGETYLGDFRECGRHVDDEVARIADVYSTCSGYLNACRIDNIVRGHPHVNGSNYLQH